MIVGAVLRRESQTTGRLWFFKIVCFEATAETRALQTLPVRHFNSIARRVTGVRAASPPAAAASGYTFDGNLASCRVNELSDEYSSMSVTF